MRAEPGRSASVEELLRLLKPITQEDPGPCPYLPGRDKQYESFYAVGLSGSELAGLLAEGWRKFGPYFFRPACPGCRRCVPLRVPVRRFAASRSQRRVLRRNRDLQVRFGPLHYTERSYQLYRAHARQRFAIDSSLNDFASCFYLSSCPALQSEIYLDGQLIAVGFLDQADDALSSVYFCFDPGFGDRSPGIFGALVEIDQARRLQLDYYYLGYLVEGCPSMHYKDHFRPREYYDWRSGCWQAVSAPPIGLPGPGEIEQEPVK